MFEERARILSMIRPLARKFHVLGSARALACRSRCPRRPAFCIQQRNASERAGKLERENFHLVVIARWVSDFISNESQRAFSGIRSGNLSAHSTTETPSPKKYS